jgi:L-seryl-tRNA(Ser) seleniumtransferase
VVLPEWCASVLRLGDPSVLGRVERGRLLLDLRSVPPEDDGAVVAAVLQLEGRF